MLKDTSWNLYASRTRGNKESGCVTYSISARGVIGDRAKGEYNDAEATEAAKAVIASQKECARRNAVCVVPGRISSNAGRDAHADDIKEDSSYTSFPSQPYPLKEHN